MLLRKEVKIEELLPLKLHRVATVREKSGNFVDDQLNLERT